MSDGIVKRFLLFSGDEYYPLGGARDFIHSFDTLDEAVAVALTVVDELEWAHIFDTHAGEVVWEAE